MRNAKPFPAVLNAAELLAYPDEQVAASQPAADAPAEPQPAAAPAQPAAGAPVFHPGVEQAEEGEEVQP